VEGSLAKPVDYAWSKVWAERIQVLNTLVADTVFGIVAFAVVQSAEIGIRTLSANNRKCPDFGNLTFADVMHYIRTVSFFSPSAGLLLA
jgi:hypothetical protein